MMTETALAKEYAAIGAATTSKKLTTSRRTFTSGSSASLSGKIQHVEFSSRKAQDSGNMKDNAKNTLEARLAHIDGTLDGIKHAQSVSVAAYGIILAGVALAVTVLIFQMQSLSGRMDRLSGRMDGMETRFEKKFDAIDQRFDALEDKVDALPLEINKNLMELTNTISASITAARSDSDQNPVVIVVPGDPGVDGTTKP